MAAMTRATYEDSLRNPAFCEAPPRNGNFWHGVMIRANGAYVAGYELSGLHSYYDSDQQRQHLKMLLEALLRTLPELSMRLQMRFEIIEGVGANR